MKYRQTTLRRDVSISGTGLHTGETAELQIRPAPADTGIVFISGSTRIPAAARNAVPAARNTTLTSDGVSLYTVEHVLSALYGLGVDNAEITLSSHEPPAMDGSPLMFCNAILDTGIVTLDAESEYLEVSSPVIVHGNGGATAAALPCDGFRVSFLLSYAHPLIGVQAVDLFVDPAAYQREIAPARTFGFIEEVDALLKSGLAKGASLENAVVIYPGRYSCLLRFPDEPVRHKVADLIGDISLTGRRLRGWIVCCKSGHALNGELAKKLLETVV